MKILASLCSLLLLFLCLLSMLLLLLLEEFINLSLANKFNSLLYGDKLATDSELVVCHFLPLLGDDFLREGPRVFFLPETDHLHVPGWVVP